MKSKYLLVLLTAVLVSCNDIKEESSENPANERGSEVVFDSKKWKIKEDLDYPHREEMLGDLLESHQLDSLNREELLDLLGEPTRTDNDYLFYRVSQERFGLWPMHTTTLVIKFANDTIDWVRIHK